MNETSTYTLTIPSSQDRIFRLLAEEMGWVIKKQKSKKKSCGMDKAMEDIREGRITTYENVVHFLDKMGI